jgi:hypothetical protein
VSDLNPETEPGAAEATPDEALELKRPDPRLRPPDPAGTQPKWDPEDLLPKEAPRAGRLWATAPEGEAAERDERETVTAAATTAPAGAATADAAAAPGAAARAADGATAADDRPAASRYSPRFQFLLGALLAVGAASIALLVAVLVGGKDDTTIVVKAGPPWSSWRPTATSGTEAANQIASHVGAQYKLPNGHQLVGVVGGPLEVQQVPVTIAIQHPAAQGGQVDFLDDGAGVMYRMNGIGTTDSRIPGKPSTNRHLLLRREALELALYSFRYLGVSQAVVLFPPSVRQTRSATTGKLVQEKADPTALLFRRDQTDVQTALAHPLASTLSTKTPTVSGVTRSPDARAVEAITDDKTYTYKLQEANTDLRLFLVLAPLRIR